MKFYDKIGDQAVALTNEYRKSDPKLQDPVRGSLARLTQWFFPAAVFRAASRPENENDLSKNSLN